MTNQELFYQGQNHFIDGQLQESIAAFTQAHDAGYDPVRSYLSRGVAFLRSHEPERAIADFTAAVTLDPDNDRAYYYRGLAKLESNDFQAAWEDLSHSLALNRERGVAYFARGIIESELGCEEDALRDFKMAVAYADVESSGFAHSFGNTRTLFDRSMALLEGERGPLSMVLSKEEVNKLEKWLEH